MNTDAVPEKTAPLEAGGPVTRVEIIDHIGLAFVGASVSTPELVAVAQQAGARPEVLALLGRLPHRRFERPHDLWTELPEVPIEA
jgi:hypothetical protein